MWCISYVPTTGCRPIFQARTRGPTSYRALSEHYYGNPSRLDRIPSAGMAPCAVVPTNVRVNVCAALAGLTSRERQVAAAHQASAFTEYMARACRPAESTVVADWINPEPFAKLLKCLKWPCRFSAIHRVERLDAPALAKDFASLRVYFLECRVFRQLEYTMEQIVDAPRGDLRRIRAFCLGDAVVVEGPKASGRTAWLAELIAHEVIHRIQRCHVGDTKRWLHCYIAECHTSGVGGGICGYRRNRYEKEAYGVAMGCRSVIRATGNSGWWVRGTGGALPRRNT